MQKKIERKEIERVEVDFYSIVNSNGHFVFFLIHLFISFSSNPIRIQYGNVPLQERPFQCIGLGRTGVHTSILALLLPADGRSDLCSGLFVCCDVVLLSRFDGFVFSKAR